LLNSFRKGNYEGRRIFVEIARERENERTRERKEYRPRKASAKRY